MCFKNKSWRQIRNTELLIEMETLEEEILQLDGQIKAGQGGGAE